MGASTTQRSKGGKAAVDPASSGFGLGARVTLVLLLLAWGYVLLAMLSFSGRDWPSHLVTTPKEQVANWCGPFGSLIAYSLNMLLGVGAHLVVWSVGLALFLWTIGRRVTHAATRALGLIVLAVSVAGLQRLLFPSSGFDPSATGGKLGVVSVDLLTSRFGPVGSGMWLVLFSILGSLIAMDEVVLFVFSWMRSTGMPAAVTAGRVTGSVVGPAAYTAAKGTVAASGGLWSRLAGSFRRSESATDSPVESGVAARMAKPRRVTNAADAPDAAFPGEGSSIATAHGRGRIIEDLSDDQDESPVAVDPDVEAAGPDADEDRAEEPTPGEPVRAYVGDDEDDDLPGAPQVFDKDALREKMSKLPVVFGQNNREIATDADLAGIQSPEQLEIEGKQYRFPGLDLLENPEENFNAKLEEHVREQAAALEAAMQQYGIDGGVVGVESGPVITLFDVRLAPGTKVAQVQAVASDIARALKAVNIRIVPNQVGRDTIGVEVPNTQKERVRLKELMAKTERYSAMKLPMFMGKDASGEPLIEDLTKMPHMLIAGTTGSGKSVCMNTIIMGFLYTKKPSELKLVLVDPKMVEMSQFRDIPHLMCPVVTEMSKAAAILEWACQKMDERYELLAEAGCRDIASYNELPWEELKERMGVVTDEEAAKIPRKLPYMVFIIDELADLMMTAKEVESHIIRIAQKARAVGLHLILATQRPQANVVTGLIKSNMPCRVAFRVASGMDSRIVLDSKGAELLLGHGDMLFLNPRTNKLTRSQGTLVDDREIRAVVKFMREVAGPSFERQLLSLRKPSEDGSGLSNLTDEERLLQSKNNSSASLKAAQEDPLFERSVDIVLETRRGSVSLLQRRLAIGYTRASRLVDLMGIAGIISDHKGSVARDVLITPEEWEMMKQLAKEEAAAKGLAWPPKTVEQGQLFAEGGTPPPSTGTPTAEPPPFKASASAPAPHDADEDDEDL